LDPVLSSRIILDERKCVERKNYGGGGNMKKELLIAVSGGSNGGTKT
jgi:hypothetical protein